MGKGRNSERSKRGGSARKIARFEANLQDWLKVTPDRRRLS